MNKKLLTASLVCVFSLSSIGAANTIVHADSSNQKLKVAKSIKSYYRANRILGFAKTKSKSEKTETTSSSTVASSTKSSSEQVKASSETKQASAQPTKQTQPSAVQIQPTQPSAAPAQPQAQSQPQPQPEPLKSAIVYQGKVMRYGPNFGPLETTNGAAYQAQAYIDASPWTNIALGWNDLNFNDGVGTYMAGHNHGVFTPLTTLDYGGTVDVYDRDGNKKTYVVKERTHLWNATGGPTTTTDEVDNMLEKMKSTESLVLQYCLENDMQLYYLVPIE